MNRGSRRSDRQATRKPAGAVVFMYLVSETVTDGRRSLYFCGTGYLGLHGHTDLIQAVCEAIRIAVFATHTDQMNREVTESIERHL